MCDVSGFVIVVASLIDGDNSPLGYGDLAGKNVSNPWRRERLGRRTVPAETGVLERADVCNATADVG